MQKLFQLAALLLLCAAFQTSFAQSAAASLGSAPAQANPAPAVTPAKTEPVTPPGGDGGEAPFDPLRIATRFEFWNALLILIFGVVVVALQYRLLLRKQSVDGNDILKVFGVTLIIVGTLFLIAAGFGDEQIAPAMGLFGTLAGYLLGRASVENGAKEATPTPSAPTTSNAGPQ